MKFAFYLFPALLTLSANAESYRISCDGITEPIVLTAEFKSPGSISDLIGLDRGGGPRSEKRIDESIKVGFGNNFDGSYTAYSFKKDSEREGLVLDLRTTKDIQDYTLHIKIDDFRSTTVTRAALRVWDANGHRPLRDSRWLNCIGKPF